MNTYTTYLSSLSSTVVILPQIDMDDNSSLNVSLSGVSESFFPLYLNVDWGDGNKKIYNNEIYKLYREESIIPEVLYGKFSSILQKTYQHEYYPSETSLFKSLTAQFLISYTDNTYSWFIQPLKIRTYDFIEATSGVKIIESNILPISSNSAEHHILTGNGQILELVT